MHSLLLVEMNHGLKMKYFMFDHLLMTYCFMHNDLCRFDKRITTFAEEKFQRDGIDLKTGAMVVKVTDKEISTKQVKNGGEISNMPYGMVVWSTGIGTRPVIMEFMKQVGQVETQWGLYLRFIYCYICCFFMVYESKRSCFKTWSFLLSRVIDVY